MKKFNIEEYISGSDSICREERQYALFLNNILLGIKAEKITGDDRKNILSACGLVDATIQHVFYEAAFMRDIFHYTESKTCFNRALLGFILRHVDSWKRLEQFRINHDVDFDNARTWSINEESVRPVDLGRRAGPKVFETLSADLKKPELRVIQSAARAMMNVKPDLALIYRKEGERYLCFIECKLESDPGTYDYEYDDGLIKVTLNQLDVQNWVAHFLCDEKHGLLRDIRVEEGDAAEERVPSRLVQFSREESNVKGNIIPISTLIDLNAGLFQ